MKKVVTKHLKEGGNSEYWWVKNKQKKPDQERYIKK